MEPNLGPPFKLVLSSAFVRDISYYERQCLMQKAMSGQVLRVTGGKVLFINLSKSPGTSQAEEAGGGDKSQGWGYV